MDLETGARHYHQGEPGVFALSSQRRQGIQAQSDRHSRPRRFHLRSFAQPGRMRRRACWSSTRPRASKRRQWPTRIWRSNTIWKFAGHQQDRFAERRSGTSHRGDRGRHRHRAPHAILASAKEGIGTEEFSKDRARISAAQGRPGCAVAGADHRLLVRSLSRRRRDDARIRRHDSKGHEDSYDVKRHRFSKYALGLSIARADASRELGAGEVGFLMAGIKKSPKPRSATPSPTTSGRHASRCPVSSR